MLKEQKLAQGQVPQWLSGSMLTLHYIGHRFAPGYHCFFTFLKGFFHSVL